MSWFVSTFLLNQFYKCKNVSRYQRSTTICNKLTVKYLYFKMFRRKQKTVDEYGFNIMYLIGIANNIKYLNNKSNLQYVICFDYLPTPPPPPKKKTKQKENKASFYDTSGIA